MSLENNVTYQYKFDELRLAVTHPNNKKITFILVEGITDERLYRKLFNLDHCKVEWIPGGNSKLEQCVIDLLPFHSFNIGIRDADFLHLNKVAYTNQNIFLTDLHDTEMSIISEKEVFSAIVHEYFPYLSKQEHLKVRTDIFKITENLSLRKWLNEKESLGISFKKNEFQDLIIIENLTIDFEQYLIRLNSKLEKNGKLSIEFPSEQIEQIKSNNLDYFQLTNGHDFTKAFAEYVRKKGNKKDLKPEDLESLYRTNYTVKHFCKTKLYDKILIWQNTNKCKIHCES